MMTDEGKAEADKARETFNRRLSAALSAPSAGDIDWASYKARLPDVDVDALRADYEAFVKAIPPQVYNEAADKSAHEAKEAAWAGFATYCKARVGELEKLAAEQADHRLHRWYRRSRVWQRFPGLYESLHHRARGTWDKELWANYLQYKARLTALPWDVNVGDVDESKRKAILSDVATRSGLAPEQVGLDK